MANSRVYLKSEAGGTTVVSRDTTAASGNLVLPASGNVASVDTVVTDNAIARYDGTTGKVQNSGVIIDDNNNITQRASLYKRDDGVSVASIDAAAGTALSFNEYTGGGYRFYTSSVEKMRIDGAGNVGIGTPLAPWHSVYKVLQLSGGSYITFSNMYGQITANSYLNTSGADAYISNGLATMYAQGGGVHSWKTAPYGTTGSAITWSNPMTLDANGNLGIGTNSPNAKLHTRVSNSSAVVDGILIENFINENPSSGNGVSVGFNLNDNGNDSTTRGRIGIINTFFGSKTDMLFHIFNSGLIEKMRLTSNGNLLIGTSTDNGVDKLQVNGDVNINGNLISKSIQGIKSDFFINDDSALLISNGLSVAEGLYAITARSPDFQASLNLLFFVSFHKFEGVSFNLISKGGRNTTAMADKVDFRTDIVGTGTTGIDGRISICCMANNASLDFALYIENRHGSVITNVSITKLN